MIILCINCEVVLEPAPERRIIGNDDVLTIVSASESLACKFCGYSYGLGHQAVTVFPSKEFSDDDATR